MSWGKKVFRYFLLFFKRNVSVKHLRPYERKHKRKSPSYCHWINIFTKTPDLHKILGPVYQFTLIRIRLLMCWFITFIIITLGEWNLLLISLKSLNILNTFGIWDKLTRVKYHHWDGWVYYPLLRIFRILTLHHEIKDSLLPTTPDKYI